MSTDVDRLIDSARDEFERDGTIDCVTFSQLTNAGLDAEAILEDFRNGET